MAHWAERADGPVAPTIHGAHDSLLDHHVDHADTLSDATGDRDWDSGRLLRLVLTDSAAARAVWPPLVAYPPDEVLELGAGTGAMAIALAAHWRSARYLATDLPCRVSAMTAAFAESGCPMLRATPLAWGGTPPPQSDGGGAGASLVLLADLLYFRGSSLFEPDTLEPLAETVRLALAARCSFALCCFRVRDRRREAHFRALCEARGLAISEPLSEARLATMLPPGSATDVEATGPLRLWRIRGQAGPGTGTDDNSPREEE